MNSYTREDIIDIVGRIRLCEGSEQEQDALLLDLERRVLDPSVSDYIFWSEMTPEEIADKVLEYRPVAL